jgi:hypothetical protein
MKVPWTRALLTLPLLALSVLGGASPARGADPDIPYTGLVLWLYPGNVSLQAGKVAVWNDLSGANNHATNASASSQPVYIPGALNGQPAVRFDGAQRLFAGPIYLSTWTIFVVGKNNNPTENFGLILGPGDNNNNQLRYENGTQVLTYGFSNNMPVRYSTIGNTRVYHNLSVRYQPGSFQVFRDGVLRDSAVYNLTGTWGLGRIGTWYSSCPTCFLKGDLVEILVYNQALSTTDRQRVETYLRTKFSLP